MKWLILFVLFSQSSFSAPPAPHACQKDALVKARNLLKFHAADFADEKQIAIAEGATILPSAKIPGIKDSLDVLEVRGFIYKANYRLRLLYLS